MVDETPEGNPFAALRIREADLEKHLSTTKGTESPDPAVEKAKEAEREAARKKLEEEAKKAPGQRLVPEFGSANDFTLQQALNRLKGLPVVVSKTLTERPGDEKKTN
jgi:carboxyl-terminal processing protease